MKHGEFKKIEFKSHEEAPLQYHFVYTPKEYYESLRAQKFGHESARKQVEKCYREMHAEVLPEGWYK